MVVDVTRSTPYLILPEWMTVLEVAVYLGWSTWTVYSNIHRGQIPHRRVGKLILIPKTFVNPDNATAQVTELAR